MLNMRRWTPEKKPRKWQVPARRFVKWDTRPTNMVRRAEKAEVDPHRRFVNPATAKGSTTRGRCRRAAGTAAAWSTANGGALSPGSGTHGARETGEAAGRPSRLPALGKRTAKCSATTVGTWGGRKSQLYKVSITAQWNCRTWCRDCYDKHDGSASLSESADKVPDGERYSENRRVSRDKCYCRGATASPAKRSGASE